MITMLMNGLIDWLVNGCVEGWKWACKMALQAGALTDGQWEAAGEIVGKLGGVMAYVTLICAAVSITWNAVRGKFGDILGVVFQAVFSWTLAMSGLYVLIQANNIAGEVTGRVLGVDLSKGDQEISMPELTSASIKGVGIPAALLLFMLLLTVVAACSIILCMAARSFLLIAGVIFLPVAIMRPGGSDSYIAAVKEYGGWLLGIILYQPVCAILIAAAGKLMTSSGQDNPMTFFTAVVGMLGASVCPWVIIRKLLHVLPGAKGLADTADTGQKTTQGVKETVKAGVEVASVVATGGASLAAGAAGGAGGAEAAAAAPKVDPPSSPSTAPAGQAPTQTVQPEESKRGRISRSLSAAASAAPSSSQLSSVLNLAAKVTAPPAGKGPVQGPGGSPPARTAPSPSPASPSTGPAAREVPIRVDPPAANDKPVVVNLPPGGQKTDVRVSVNGKEGGDHDDE